MTTSQKQKCDRVQTFHIARRLRAAGVHMLAQDVGRAAREIGLGRYIRVPMLGWVLSQSEADEFEARIDYATTPSEIVSAAPVADGK